jgi:NTP pyrophosphatase (non-canonical NTP hydrolase)
MRKLNLNQAIKETEKVCKKFPNPKKWTSHHRFAELVEEIGKLANAIQTMEGYKSKKRQKSEINDSICDILYEVFMMAATYKVDLDNEYPKVLKQLEERIRAGEFDH